MGPRTRWAACWCPARLERCRTAGLSLCFNLNCLLSITFHSLQVVHFTQNFTLLNFHFEDYYINTVRACFHYPWMDNLMLQKLETLTERKRFRSFDFNINSKLLGINLWKWHFLFKEANNNMEIWLSLLITFTSCQCFRGWCEQINALKSPVIIVKMSFMKATSSREEQCSGVKWGQCQMRLYFVMSLLRPADYFYHSPPTSSSAVTINKENFQPTHIYICTWQQNKQRPRLTLVK